METDRELLAIIEREFTKADRLALKNQRRSDRLFLAFGVMAALTGALFLTYAALHHVWGYLIGYLVLLLGGILLLRLSRRMRWFRQHLLYRTLAEVLRTRLYLAGAGISDSPLYSDLLELSGVTRYPGYGLVSLVSKSVEPTFSGGGSGSWKPDDHRFAAVERRWVDGQIGYFETKTTRMLHTLRRFGWVKTGLVVVTVLGLLCLIVFGNDLATVDLGGGVIAKGVVIFFVALLPYLVGVWGLYESKLATPELLWLYRDQADSFRRAQSALQTATTAEEKRGILIELGPKVDHAEPSLGRSSLSPGTPAAELTLTSPGARHHGNARLTCPAVSCLMDSVTSSGCEVMFLAHQVFLSYATEDADSARLLCRVLEAEEGIRCWIAPRDVPAGTDYAAAILEAIKNAELVLLLFSAFTNTSPYVLREIERAVAYERPVISVRLDSATPNPSLEYYLNMLQWLDAPRGIESKRREIVAALRKQLEGDEPAALDRNSVLSAPAPRVPRGATPWEKAARPARPREAERRLVTVLVAGIADFAGLSARLDPEALHDLIASYFERVTPAIERYGGTVHKVTEETIVAVFGAPKAHEDDPERALHAALEMRQAIAAFSRPREVTAAIQLGVSSGLVYAGGTGSAEGHSYSVVGEAVTEATRLRDRAKPGEILVGEDTRRAAESSFTWGTASRGPGRASAASSPAHPLLDARLRGVGENARPGRGLFSSLVGREEDLAAFETRLAGLIEGQGGVILLSGEAGLGKSRLVAEARERAENAGICWLEGRTLSFGRTISYWPLLEILQQDAGIETDDPESERWVKLASRLRTLFGDERAEVLPYFATLLNLSLPEDSAEKVRYLDGEAVGRQVYRATRLYFGRLAQRRPTVIVFEDLHWLDASTELLLEHLLPLIAEVPILFCLVSRPEPQTAYSRLRELVFTEYAGRLTEIVLGPLSEEESAVLVRNLVSLEELPPRLKSTITEKSEGNPFYVEEVVRSLIDQGGFEPDPATGRYKVTEKAVRIPIPDTLHGVIMARIDRLDDDLKQILRLASVVGRSFFYRVLASIAEAEQELDQDLAELETRELIQEKAKTPELEYIFKHALVQEATYESILIARRKELHRRVAVAMETLFPDRLEGFCSLLAYHYSKAEDWEKAQEYLFKAGDQAASIAADTEALTHYGEAIEAYSRVFGDAWDPLERAVLERKMGEALYRRGDHAVARDYLYQALATLGRPIPESSRAVRRQIAREVLVQVWHRKWPWFKPSQQAPEEIRQADEYCRVCQSLGWVEAMANQERSLLIMLIDLNLAEEYGIGWASSSGASAIAMMLTVMPTRRSRSYIARARLIAEQQGLPAERAQADLVAGMYEFWHEGALEKAEEWLRRSSEGFRQVGDIRSSAGIAMGVGVHVPAERGDFQQALLMAREIGRSGRDAGDRLTEAYGDAWESELLYMSGDLAAGEAGMRRTIEAMLSATDYRISSKVAGRLAACLLAQGRLEEAQTLLAEHREYLRKYGIRGFNATMVITGTAATALSAAEQAADRSRDVALKEAKRRCNAAVKQGKLDMTALVPAYRLQGTYEWLSDHPSKACDWWRRSLNQAERLGARYEGALTMLEWGKRAADGEQLRQAESEFAAMGSKFFEAEARQLLRREEEAGETLNQ